MTTTSKTNTDKKKYLWSTRSDDAALLLQEVVMHVVSSKRYGKLSSIAAITPMYVYDNPTLTEFSKTGFTDGIHCFFNADFLREQSAKTKQNDVQDKPTSFVLQMTALRLLKNNFNADIPEEYSSFTTTQSVRDIIDKVAPATPAVISLAETIKLFEKSGLKPTIKSLELPASDDSAAIANIEASIAQRETEALGRTTRYKI